jgi:cytochrome c556
MRAGISIAILLCVGSLLIANPQVQETTNPVAPQTKEKQEASDQDKPVSFWMEKKFEYSQTLLRGLATGDFIAIEKSGRQLATLNRVEGFVRNHNDDYRAHLNTFQQVCGEIVRQAKKENLEGSTLAFNQLTVSCVNCHRSLRRE